MPETVDLLLIGAGQILTCRGSSEGPKRGRSLSDAGLLARGAVAVAEGKILAVGSETDVKRKIGGAEIGRVIDAEGRIVLPGWIDPHTHAVFSRYRPDEYEARIVGESYLEIDRRGGGIRRTVREVREMGEVDLFEVSRRRVTRMLEQGTTTVEIKSGYGLDLESELKMLRVISRLREKTPIDAVSTFMGAHHKPTELREGDSYLRIVVNEMIPVVAGKALAEFIDVFCEEGVFGLEETEEILDVGRRHGLKLKVHADEINAIGGTQLAVKMGAVSADHLIRVSDAGIGALAESSTIAVLLPATTFGLASKDYAPARRLIDAGAAVALATDYNPGSAPSSSMQFVVSLACLQMGMKPAEAINAATYNAAFAVGREASVGSLEIGKKADLVIYEMEDYREIPARAGINHAFLVLKEGRVVRENSYLRQTSEVGF